jgi:hypothetical protein
MKKLFTFLAVILMAQLSFGQTFISEDFSGTFPPPGWTIDGANANWSKSATVEAGGQAPELKFTYINQNITTRFISPAIDLTGSENVTLSFKYFYDWYANGVTLGVAKRFGTTGAWEIAWSVMPTGDQGPKSQTVEFSNVGQADFQFCVFLSGNLYNMDYAFFDDLKLFVRQDRDAGLHSLSVPDYFAGEMPVSGKVINEGISSLNSFDVNWSLNEGTTNTTSFSGLNIATDVTYDFSCDQLLIPPTGTHNLKVWVSNVNGLGNDQNIENDLITKVIGIPTQTLQRRPLFEQFTSSTCPPCAPFNNNTMIPFINAHGEDVSIIKYQMNWPSAGDPYYTAEGGVRRTFYGVSVVPYLIGEGANVATSTPAVNAAYTAAMAKPAFVNITGIHSVEGNNFSVSGSITPYLALTNATLHVVIVEKTTTGNVGTNGETSFKHVMMKMMPNANGTTLNIESGATFTYSFTHDMSTTNVEEMDDLMAVIFVQNNSTKYIFQSAYSALAGTVAAVVTFDPASGTTGIHPEADFHINYNMPVQLIGGGEITNDNVASLISFKEVDDMDFPFTATINDEKTMITVDPTGTLNSYTSYELAIAEVQNANAIVTPAASATFETLDYTNVNELTAGLVGVYPNPASNEVNIAYFVTGVSKVEVALIDLSGRTLQVIEKEIGSAGQQSVQFLTADVANGTYFVRLKINETVKTTKLVINK